MRRFYSLIFFIALITVAIHLTALPTYSSLTNVYISQSGAGAMTGVDCADAEPVTFFNTAGNWGTGAAQIGPGTEVHLCGTFTGSSGATMLTIQGSGSSGNPVIIHFETNAQLNAPYWGDNPDSTTTGAIVCNGFNYITIDGGTNGIIQNTANGTSLANQHASTEMNSTSCSNVEIENLTLANAYVKTSISDENFAGGGVTELKVFGGSHIKVHNITGYQSRNVFSFAYVSDTDWEIYSNNLDHACHVFEMGDDSGGDTISSVSIHDNTLGPHQYIWQDPATNCHGDGLGPLSAFNSNSEWSNSSFYNNTITSDMCADLAVSPNCTAPVFFTGYFNGINFFNNVVAYVDTGSGMGNGESLIRFGIAGTSNPLSKMINFNVLNNTFDGGNLSGNITYKTDANSSPSFVIKNNIYQNVGWVYVEVPCQWTDWNSLDYNDFHNISNNVAGDCAGPGGGTQYNTLANWQTATIAGGAHPDLNSITGNPSLNTSYIPQTGSAAIGTGANLCSLSITALDYDHGGYARPCPSGAWTMGAWNATGGPSQVATPSISPTSGGYTSPQTITITDSTVTATICYTNDGSTPTANGAGTCTHGTTYTAAFSQTIVTTTTIKAIGTASGYTDSAIATNSYTLAGGSTVANPVISPGTGNYGSPQTVTITDSTAGATICYTTDGSSPAASTPGTCSHGTTYTGAFSVSFTTTASVKALGTLASYTNSSIVTATYTFTSTACTGPNEGCDTQIRYGPVNPTHCQPHALFGNTNASPTVYYECTATDTWTKIAANNSPTTCTGTNFAQGVDSSLNAVGCSTPGGTGVTMPNPIKRHWAYASANSNGFGTGAVVGDAVTTVGTTSFAAAGTGAGQFEIPVGSFNQTTSGGRATLDSAFFGGGGGWSLVGKNMTFETALAISTTTSIRFRAGVGNGTGTNWISADSLTSTIYAAFRFSTTASDTHFQCESGNGTAVTTVDSGVTPSANTIYLLSIQFNDSTPNIVYQINGSTVCTITTNLPATNSVMPFNITLSPQTSVSETLYVGWFYEEADN